MKISVLVSSIIAISFMGCSLVQPEVRYVDRTTELKIPVKCEHPKCPTELIWIDDNEDFVTKSEKAKLNIKLLRKENTCLRESIKVCEKGPDSKVGN